MSKRGFLTEIFCRYNTKHTEIISGALFSFTTHKLWEHLVRTFTVS